MNAAEIRNTVDQVLEKAGAAYSVRYVGETKRDDWRCDAWRFTFAVHGRPLYEGDYFTGLGHRKAPGGRKNPYLPRTTNAQYWDEQFLRPRAPRAADVLHSLLLDSDADSMSFRDWCDSYGYSSDSISAFDTYRQCCDVAVRLRGIFPRETLDALRDAVQEL